MNKELSIIVVHYKKPSVLRLCLKSIKKFVKNVDYEIIVTDSATSEESRDLVAEEFSEVKFIPFKENTGYSKGINAGIKKAEGEYILILNPDAVISDDSVNKMMDFIKKNPDVGVVGPALLNFNDSVQPSCFRFYTPLTVLTRRSFLSGMPYFRKLEEKFLMKDKDLSKTQDVGWIMGSAMMTKKECVKKIGPMDERFFMYFEDVDWCRRFWDNGMRVVYYPEAKIYHYLQKKSKHGFGLADLLLGKAARWHLASGMKYFVKYGFFSQKTAQ